MNIQYYWLQHYKYFSEYKLKSQVSDWSKSRSASKLTNQINGSEFVQEEIIFMTLDPETSSDKKILLSQKLYGVFKYVFFKTFL